MIIELNKKRTGFSIPSEYNKSVLADWLKKYDAFDLEPRIQESKESRGYLEGGVVRAYCEWQYGIDARAGGKSEQRRFLFKRDFNYEIVEDRQGNPVRSPVSSKGKAKKVLKEYQRYSEENGAPLPNPALYNLWRDEWSMDSRFPTFFEFLDFLELECDAFPSDQTLAKLGEKKKVHYPTEEKTPTF